MPVGEGTPGVVTYFANVPMPALSSNAPNFDISSVQVLKGPQGTLFGRNTLGGAVLITPALPSYDFGGYITALYGRSEEHTPELQSLMRIEYAVSCLKHQTHTTLHTQ